MYNKNGLIIMNRPLGGTVGGSGNMSTMNLTAGEIKYSDGTTNAYTVIYYGYSTNVSVNALTKFHITGRSSADYLYQSNVNTGPNGISFHIGYRSTPFDENTFNPVFTNEYSSQCGRSVVAGIPVITLFNNTTENMLVNQIAFSCSAGDSSNSITKRIVFAGFNFPTVTVAPGESYTFTLIHKNS